MASDKKTSSRDSDLLPFGAGALEPASTAEAGEKRRRPRRRRSTRSSEDKPAKEPRSGEQGAGTGESAGDSAGGAGGDREGPARENTGGERAEGGEEHAPRRRRRWQDRRSRRRKKGRGPKDGGARNEGARNDGAGRPAGDQRQGADEGQRAEAPAEPRRAEGMLVLEKANHGFLRSRDNDYLPTKQDVHVPPRLVQKFHLTEGALLTGTVRRGQGRHKWDLAALETVDGKDPKELQKLTPFKQLTSIDPDFHYAVGDSSGEVSLKIVDLICPIGRGQRGVIVAPPRSGKTILLQQFAHAVEDAYPEVHLMVLLVDERPEEATEWKRALKRGEVFVSTNDEMHKRHVELSEAVWKRCKRLVELGEDVILLLDSITRLGRAYNNVRGNSGKTMSGGVDTRALEIPKQLFGSARNTETAGSLTILGTCLIETGSRMDQVIFEEFKGTGNMELVLSRKLADRRIFPAIDIQRSGTRKEEKLISSRRLHLIQTLRRVLLRMHFTEAMELLVTKLDEVEKTDDFLSRFEVDPEA